MPTAVKCRRRRRWQRLNSKKIIISTARIKFTDGKKNVYAARAVSS